MPPMRTFLLTFLLFSMFLQAQPLAFPASTGFGALSSGGRAGTTIHVTNLNDTGPGSFRDAVSAEKRFVDFDVAGVIHIKSPLSIASNVTIAGQSAPGDGVAI